MVALTTKLDAVNTCLESVWEAPVSTLEVSGVASVAQAKRVLDKVSRAVQTRGWSFNTEEDLTLTPDVNSIITLPANTLEVDSFGVSADKDVVQRGTQLYDRGKHTFTFTVPVHVRIIYLFDFEDLPESARNYIAVQAARVFRDEYQQKDTTSPPTMIEMEALRNFEQHEAQTQDSNMLNDSWSVAQTLQR
jgi:hypothetical protein